MVHAHVYSAGLPALLLGAISRAPVVVTEHFTGFQRGVVTGYERLLARVAFERADLVAPVSEELAGHLREIAPGARMRVLPNVVDTDVFAVPEENAPREGARLLTVGALAEKKGHAYLLEALALMDGDRRLDVVGDGELRERLEARARELGLAERVRFRGELPKDEVAALMRAADLFVLPSIHETFGCVLIEAMASGLPAVATRVGGVPEVLTPAAGELVPARDPQALADGDRAGAGAILRRPGTASLRRGALRLRRLCRALERGLRGAAAQQQRQHLLGHHPPHALLAVGLQQPLGLLPRSARAGPGSSARAARRASARAAALRSRATSSGARLRASGSATLGPGVGTVTSGVPAASASICARPQSSWREAFTNTRAEATRARHRSGASRPTHSTPGGSGVPAPASQRSASARSSPPMASVAPSGAAAVHAAHSTSRPRLAGLPA